MPKLTKLRFSSFIHANGEGDGGGGNDAPKSAPPPAPETFSREYVQELRAENKGWRLKAQEMEAFSKAAKDEAEKIRAEAESKLAEADSRANERIIRAELKAAAIKAGMIDLDGLKLADMSSVKLSDDGDVVGAADMLATLKESKPYLFKTATTTTTAPPPKPSNQGQKKATDMDATEWAAVKKEHGLR